MFFFVLFFLKVYEQFFISCIFVDFFYFIAIFYYLFIILFVVLFLCVCVCAGVSLWFVAPLNSIFTLAPLGKNGVPVGLFPLSRNRVPCSPW